MHVLSTAQQAREFVWKARAAGQSVGVVPTMGALHRGHLSLVEQSRATCDLSTATIFVNPTQFGPGEDLSKYPRSLDEDLQQLEGAGTAAVFVPETQAMYPAGFSTYIDPPAIAAGLEGVCRPDHFRGVATVVLKLFHAVPATHAFFGRKDYQQLKVIEAMVRDLNLGIQVRAGDTVREADGLALSSRNRYLTQQDRSRALLLSTALAVAERLVKLGERSVSTVEQAMRNILLDQNADEGEPAAEQRSKIAGRVAVDKLDYAVVVDAETLSPLVTLDRPAVALIAAFVGGTRLIDNRVLDPNAI